MNKVIEEAIANIASTSEAIEQYCNEAEHYNADGIEILERMSWELHKQASDMRELQYRYGF